MQYPSLPTPSKLQDSPRYNCGTMTLRRRNVCALK
jgi:hypothetical protein